MIIITLLNFLTTILCTYTIPSYYGHFSKNFFISSYIKSATFRYFQYHYQIDIDSTNKTVYYVNSDQHCIYKYNAQTKRNQILAGKCGTSGDRIGGIDVMLLKNPMSVVSFQYNQQSAESQNNMVAHVVANSNCNLNSNGCIISDFGNSANLKMDNIRLYPPIQQFPTIDPTKATYLYVSDTGNHCIKKIDLSLKTSTVVAGQCGTTGFTDGPTGFNKLNKPTNLGITRHGILYFYDLGNQCMRKLDTNGYVYTLLNGACKLYGNSRQIGGYKLKNILCYDNWIQGRTKDTIQHIIDNSQIQICTQHSSKC